jgi:hypothetical protein
MRPEAKASNEAGEGRRTLKLSRGRRRAWNVAAETDTEMRRAQYRRDDKRLDFEKILDQHTNLGGCLLLGRGNREVVQDRLGLYHLAFELAKGVAAGWRLGG